MNNDQNNLGKIVGLQIGGTVGPNDRVGMHVSMPSKPRIVVKVEFGDDINKTAKEVAASISDNHPKAREIRQIVGEILAANDKETKLKKVQTLVTIGSGITQIAVAIGKLTVLLGL